MYEILPGLYLGSIIQGDTTTLALNNAGITCIINCTKDHPFPPGESYLKERIAVLDPDVCLHKEEALYAMYVTLDYAADLIYNMRLTHRTLVHCYAGRQRSVCVICAYLMKYALYNHNEALIALRAKSPNASGDAFTEALQRYEVDLAKNLEDNYTDDAI